MSNILVLEHNQPTRIKYVDSKGSQTTRTILPLDIPIQNVRALDVSDMPDNKIQQLVKLRAEYSEYVKIHMSTITKFEDWVELTCGIVLDSTDLKYRTFKLANMSAGD